MNRILAQSRHASPNGRERIYARAFPQGAASGEEPDIWETAQLLIELVDEQTQRIAALEQSVTDKARTFAQILDQVSDLRANAVDKDALEALSTSVDEYAATVRGVCDQMLDVPRQMAIDGAGDLIAFTPRGELNRIGHVVGADGVTIESVDMVADTVRAHMSNGKSIVVDMPPASAEHEATIRMESGAVEHYGEIGKDIGISARKVAQVVRAYRGADNVA